jgi:hypothetical protein
MQEDQAGCPQNPVASGVLQVGPKQEQGEHAGGEAQAGQFDAIADARRASVALAEECGWQFEVHEPIAQ